MERAVVRLQPQESLLSLALLVIIVKMVLRLPVLLVPMGLKLCSPLQVALGHVNQVTIVLQEQYNLCSVH
jgi:hypothetical protein